jgi:hypothetical protein
MPNLPGEFARISRWLYTSRMTEIIALSRGKLAAFQACPRRFYLRYQRQMAWPAPPLDGTTAVAIQQGAQFHQLLQRRFLDLPLADDLAADEQLADWHAIFQRHGPKLPPDGRRYVEFTLTAPLGDCLLTGRFDLLLLTADRAHIYDWKTERRPRAAVALREDLQTRLYLALLYEGAAALDVDSAAGENPVNLLVRSRPGVPRYLHLFRRLAQRKLGLFARVSRPSRRRAAGRSVAADR